RRAARGDGRRRSAHGVRRARPARAGGPERGVGRAAAGRPRVGDGRTLTARRATPSAAACSGLRRSASHRAAFALASGWKPTSRMRRLATAPAIGIGLLLSGCSARMPPSAKLATADVAVHEAEDAGAAVRAPVELRDARDKLERATRAADDDDYDDARRLAEEAYIDAQHARMKAEAARARDDAADVRR